MNLHLFYLPQCDSHNLVCVDLNAPMCPPGKQHLYYLCNGYCEGALEFPGHETKLDIHSLRKILQSEDHRNGGDGIHFLMDNFDIVAGAENFDTAAYVEDTDDVAFDIDYIHIDIDSSLDLQMHGVDTEDEDTEENYYWRYSLLVMVLGYGIAGLDHRGDIDSGLK